MSRTPGVLRVALIGLVPFALGSVAVAQCNWDTQAPACSTNSLGDRECNRYTTGLQTCSPTGMNNAYCGAITVMSQRLLFAVGDAPANGTEYCQWQCGGETCRINLLDGLPVELLDFAVEESVETAAPDQNAEKQVQRQ